MMINYSNFFCFVYFGMTMPLTRKFDNRLELFNETLVQMMMTLLFCFSDFVQDDLARYRMSFSFMALLGILMLVNLVVISLVSGRGLYVLVGVKLFKRLERWRIYFFVEAATA
jgi:hypothetical protein